MDYNYLKGKIVENGHTFKSFAKKVGIAPQTFSNKLNKKVGFKQEEIKNISVILELNADEISRIFF